MPGIAVTRGVGVGLLVLEAAGAAPVFLFLFAEDRPPLRECLLPVVSVCTGVAAGELTVAVVVSPRAIRKAVGSL
jgi:hypothetical protein